MMISVRHRCMAVNVRCPAKTLVDRLRQVTNPERVHHEQEIRRIFMRRSRKRAKLNGISFSRRIRGEENQGLDGSKESCDESVNAEGEVAQIRQKAVCELAKSLDRAVIEERVEETQLSQMGPGKQAFNQDTQGQMVQAQNCSVMDKGQPLNISQNEGLAHHGGPSVSTTRGRPPEEEIPIRQWKRKARIAGSSGQRGEGGTAVYGRAQEGGKRKNPYLSEETGGGKKRRGEITEDITAPTVEPAMQARRAQ